MDLLHFNGKLLKVLDEQILENKGVFHRVRRYIEGWYPELGKLHQGWTGRETIIETSVIKIHQVHTGD